MTMIVTVGSLSCSLDLRLVKNDSSCMQCQLAIVLAHQELGSYPSVEPLQISTGQNKWIKAKS